MYFIQTTDVELVRISSCRTAQEAAETIRKISLPIVLDLYDKYDVKGTFFFTGKIVELEPEVVSIVKERGHEIGCHGYTHDSAGGFDTMPYEKQVEYLSKAKNIIEAEAGKIISFRSPELRIGRETVRALEATGFEIDCSIASQRFDGPISYGSKNKLGWLIAPRKPYFLSYNSPFRTGDSSIFEIPITAFLAPYIGTFMRIAPKAYKVFEDFMFWESKMTGKPIVFLFHPTECISGVISHKWSLRNGMLAILRDGIRQKLKMKNLGNNAIELMEQTFCKANRKGFRFVSAKQYRELALQKDAL